MPSFFDPELKIKAVVPSSHHLSLPLAVALAKLIADSSSATQPSEVERIHLQVKNLKRRPRSWKAKCIELLDDCAIATDKPSYGLDDLEIMAQHLRHYHIRLYHRVPPAKIYSLKWEENTTGAKKLHIACFKNQFDVFTPKRSTIGKTLCDACYEPYLRVDRHKCTAVCIKCRRKGCTGTAIRPIKCPGCNVTFYLQECLDAHKRTLNRRPGRTTCDRFKRCPEIDCNSHYRPENLREDHVCGNNVYCSNCQDHVNPLTHNCCWIPPNAKDVQKKMEKQSKFKIVTYDFETVLLEDSTDISSYCEQWPNYVCYSTMCHDCFTRPIEEPCDNCGPLRKGYFKHDGVNDRRDTVVNKFLHFLLFDSSLDDALVIAHNASRFDLHFMIRPILRKKIIPQIVKNGLKIFQLKINREKGEKHNRLKFKDSCLFLPMALSSLPKAFGFEDMKKGTFPYLFNHPDNYGTVLPNLPPLDMYSPDTMKPDGRETFIEWYEEHKHQPFNFNEELHSYCENDVALLHQGLARYMKASLDMTGFNPIIHSCTFASFSFFLIKHKHMKPGQVGILPENGYHSNDVQSKLAINYIKWIEQRDGIELQYILRGGEHFFHHNNRKIKVDAYNAATNTVYEVLGCMIHGCIHHTRGNRQHPFYYKTMKEVYDETMARLKIIRDQGYNLITVWEHEIDTELATNREMRKFFKSVLHHRRLIVRDSFYGGRTQNFVLKAEPDVSKRQTIDHLDVNSMYPYVLSNTPMPMGQPAVIVKDFEPIVLPLPYRGFYMIDILPPTNLRHPIVPMRQESKLIFPLCRSCAIAQKNTACTHTASEDRYLHVTLYQAELEKALEHGYEVLRTYEVWHWPEDKWGGDLFKDFLNDFIKVKMESSGWPASGMTDEEKDQLIADLHEKEGILMDKGKVEKNLPLRTISKLAINSSWGKFAEKSGKVTSTFHEIDADDDLGWIFNEESIEVSGIQYMDGMLMVSHKQKDVFQTPQPFTNCAIAAITTCMGRLMLWEALHRLGDRALYCDTDSVVMLSEPGKDNLDDLRGAYLGKWQSEVPEGFRISKFVSTGAKVYSYQMENMDGTASKEVVKARGITLDSKTTLEVNFETMQQQVEKLVKDDEVMKITTSRPQIVKKLGQVFTKEQLKNLKPVMNKLRYDSNYCTLPYGFIE